MPSKWMWIVAGPNGAGKSSFAGELLIKLGHRTLIKLNADERTLELRKQFPNAEQNELNLKAAIAVDKDVEDCIATKHSFVVETVLSSNKYQDDVITAKAKSLKFGLIYVSVHPPEMSPERVKVRVKKGGHAVEHDKAIERYHKSHEQLGWFAPKADTLLVFDNSRDNVAPVLLASRLNGKPLNYRMQGLNPAVDQALTDLLPKPLKPDFGEI